MINAKVSLSVSVYLIVMILAMPVVYASNGFDDDYKEGDGAGSSDNVADELNDALARGESYSGTAPANTQVNLPGGGSATVSGNVQVTQGSISHADSLSFGQADFQSVDGFSSSGESFWAEFIELLTVGSVTVRNAEGIAYENNLLTAEHAEKVEDDSAIIVSHASSVGSGDVKVTDASNTKFIISDFFIEAQPKNNTKLNIVDASGNQLEFESSGNDSKVIISTTEPSIIIIRNGLFKHEYDNITEAISAANTATIRMGDKGFQCIKIEPVATFWYHEYLMIDFGINIPHDSHKYTLCLRKFAKEDFNDTDGIVDYVDKTILLSGIANYLRYPIFEKTILDYLMSSIYEGKANSTRAIMVFDNEMMEIDDFYLGIVDSSGATRAVTFAGYHKIEEASNRYDVILEKPHGDLIRHYHTENIELDVWFGKNVSSIINMLFQPNDKLGTSIKVYPPIKQTQDKLTLDLEKCFKERNMENEIKISS